MDPQPLPFPGQPTPPGVETAPVQATASGKAIAAFILCLVCIFIVPCVIVGIVLGHLENQGTSIDILITALLNRF